MAAADATRRVLVLLLLGVLSAGPCPGILATEHYSPLSLLKQELQHRQQQEAPAGGGCSPQSGDWGDQYSVECGGEWAPGGRASGSPGAAGAAGPWERRAPGPRCGAARASPPASAALRALLREPAPGGVVRWPLPAARTHAAARPPRSSRGEGGEWRKERTACSWGQSRPSGVPATVERVEERMASGRGQPWDPLWAPRVPGSEGGTTLGPAPGEGMPGPSWAGNQVF